MVGIALTEFLVTSHGGLSEPLSFAQLPRYANRASSGTARAQSSGFGGTVHCEGDSAKWQNETVRSHRFVRQICRSVGPLPAMHRIYKEELKRVQTARDLYSSIVRAGATHIRSGASWLRGQRSDCRLRTAPPSQRCWHGRSLRQCCRLHAARRLVRRTMYGRSDRSRA